MYLIIYFLIAVINNKINAHTYFEVINNFKHLSDDINAINKYQVKKLPPQWIQQHLDNFNPDETKKWNMKYYENLEFWKDNGPMYVFIGGEGPLTPGFLTTGLMYDLAKETNGAMFATEHRFYGDSKPVNITNAKDFEFLTARQALADIATFIQTLKPKSFNSSKVVVVGGSYAGNLAAWMRELYPNLVDAAVASSAPVLAKKDFFEYLEKVYEDYESYGTDDCLNLIEERFKRYEELIRTTKGIKELKEKENICDECNMELQKNQQVFFAYMVMDFMYNAQYGTTYTIKKHCDRIENATKNLENTDKYHFKQSEECNDYSFETLMEAYKLKEYDWALAWTYQTCTEYGYYQTTNSDLQPFSKNIPLKWYINICQNLFGENFNEARVDEGVENVNKLYGGRYPNVTAVVFANGELDPWSKLSVLEDISYDAPAVMLPRSSHCIDLYPNRKNDLEEVIEARNYIKYLIKSWIGAVDYN